MQPFFFGAGGMSELVFSILIVCIGKIPRRNMSSIFIVEIHITDVDAHLVLKFM